MVRTSLDAAQRAESKSEVFSAPIWLLLQLGAVKVQPRRGENFQNRKTVPISHLFGTRNRYTYHWNQLLSPLTISLLLINKDLIQVIYPRGAEALGKFCPQTKPNRFDIEVGYEINIVRSSWSGHRWMQLGELSPNLRSFWLQSGCYYS